MLVSGERIVRSNGVDLCTETFGDARNSTILLVMGACASMVWWPDDFCRALADHGKHVIRYDHRDTGKSTTYEPGTPPYTLDDLAIDAIGVLDAYDVAQAHLVGASLGGMIGQIISLSKPERLATLTLIMSSAVGRERPDLPPIEKKVLDYHASAMSLDWSNREAVLEYMIGGWRVTAGTNRPFDEETIRGAARAEVNRANNLLCMFNHSRLTGGESYHGRLDQITVPTLVIHGTEDPVLPYVHGVTLAREIPGAKLITLKGAGHELHRLDWPTIIGEIEKHTVVE